MNVLPPPEFGVNQILPPWPSTIDRVTSSPNPIPLVLVVTNDSNIRFATDGSTPGPVSHTLTPIHPIFSGQS